MGSNNLARAAAAALIKVQGGRRYCASCRLLKPADKFKRCSPCGPLRCEACSARSVKFGNTGSGSCKR